VLKSTRLRGLCVALFALLVAPAATADKPFDVERFTDAGRTVMAEIIDLDGDGRMDLLQVVMRGIPPAQKRVIVVRLQGADGKLPAQPTFEIPSPLNTAAYDFGDLRDTPGTELLLLRGQDLLILSLASADAPRWTLPIPDGTSAGAAEDERGLEQLRMIYDDFGDETWILVPLFGRMIVLSTEGELLATMTVPPRANFYIPPAQGFYFGESDMQLFFDAPRISVGDIDGDGKADLAAANRHEIRVFLQRNGTFPAEPSRVVSLGLVSEKDHIRGSGGVTANGSDFNGDGRMDLLVSHVSGSFRDARTITTAYLNRDGDWDRENPVGVFESQNALAGDLLVDLDADGRPELLRTEVPMSVLEVVELLVTGAIDAKVSVHPFREGRFSRKPTARLKLGIPVSFETFRTAGFLPQVHMDANGDGLRDLLLGGEGDEFEIRLGGQKTPFSRAASRQSIDTSGELRSADFDADGLTDFLIFNPQMPGGELKLLRNRGTLPGSPPRLRSRE
jgi:hypothetical protein